MRRTLALAWLAALLSCSVASVGRTQESNAPENVAALATDGTRLYLGSFDRGLYVREPDGALHGLSDPALDRNINSLTMERSAGRLWVGTARGLVRCTLPPAFRCERLSASSSVHATLLLSDGTLLAGGDHGLLAVLRSGETVLLDRKRNAPFRAVWALAQSGDGTVFVGATNGLHFARLDAFLAPNGLRRRVGMITEHLPDDWVTALAVAGDTVAVGTYSAGLVALRLHEGRLTRSWDERAVGYVNPAGVQRLRDGRFAVASMSGLHLGGAAGWHTLPTKSGDVTAIVEDRTGVWIGTRAGAVHFGLP